MDKSTFTEEAEQQLRMTLKRCQPEVIEAAVAYRKDGDKSQASTVVLGIIERFLEPESRPKLQDANADDYRLIEDLGVDSLVMVEIVMTIEEVLDISIPNEDLRELAKISDIKSYIKALVSNKESSLEHANT